MDKVTDTRTEFRLKQWTTIIQACQASGLTVAAWCRENNISTKSYYYRLRRLRSKACESKDLTVPNKKRACEKKSVKKAFYDKI